MDKQNSVLKHPKSYILKQLENKPSIIHSLGEYKHIDNSELVTLKVNIYLHVA